MRARINKSLILAIYIASLVSSPLRGALGISDTAHCCCIVEILEIWVCSCSAMLRPLDMALPNRLLKVFAKRWRFDVFLNSKFVLPTFSWQHLELLEVGSRCCYVTDFFFPPATSHIDMMDMFGYLIEHLSFQGYIACWQRKIARIYRVSIWICL